MPTIGAAISVSTREAVNRLGRAAVPASCGAHFRDDLHKVLMHHMTRRQPVRYAQMPHVETECLGMLER